MQIEPPHRDGDWVRGRLECPSPICGERFRISVQAEHWKSTLPPAKAG